MDRRHARANNCVDLLAKEGARMSSQPSHHHELMAETSVKAAMDVAARINSAATPDHAKDVEPALKVILSALWNLSAHCRKNKVRDITVDLYVANFKTISLCHRRCLEK